MPDKPERTPYQQKVIRNYYRNQGAIRAQSLADLVSDLWLATTDAKRATLWKRAQSLLEGLGVPASRWIPVVERRDVQALAVLAAEPFASDRKSDGDRDAREDRRRGAE